MSSLAFMRADSHVLCIFCSLDGMGEFDRFVEKKLLRNLTFHDLQPATDTRMMKNKSNNNDMNEPTELLVYLLDFLFKWVKLIINSSTRRIFSVSWKDNTLV